MKETDNLNLDEAILLLDAYINNKPFPKDLVGFNEEKLWEEMVLFYEEKSSGESSEDFLTQAREIFDKSPGDFKKLLLAAKKIPPLRFSKRKGDWDILPESLRDSMLYAYLFDGLSLRELDEAYLLFDSDKTKGFESLRVLHFMGVTGDFRGIFKGFELVEGLRSLKKEEIIHKHLIEALQRYGYSLYQQETHSENDNLESVVREGGGFLHYTTRYERSPYLRKQAIEFHGIRCMACGFDFEEVYGELGKDFIEVHHTVGFPDPRQDLFVDPHQDLQCLCSNCHRMIHRKRGDILRVDQLRRIIEEQK
ncbi:MAG: hypothetical protein GX046_04225 [Tissierellia bacterium]|nr:hypothetical protein [Tissierellia bacterium]